MGLKNEFDKESARAADTLCTDLRADLHNLTPYQIAAAAWQRGYIEGLKKAEAVQSRQLDVPFPSSSLFARQAPEPPRNYTCKLCGQHITDGKPCGCGARPVEPITLTP